MLAASSLFGVFSFAVLSDGGRAVRHAAPLGEQLDHVLVAAGFGVDEVWLTGHRYTVDSDLFAALGLEHNGSLLRFDVGRARRSVEQLPWVDTADVTRVFPNQLRVEVHERKPFAVWMHDGRRALVDATGRILAYVTESAGAELPRIRGEGAPSAAGELMAALRPYAAIAQRVSHSDRVGGRRWTLVLENGSEIHLPARGEAKAIERLAALETSQHLLDQGPISIDLRLDHRIAIRRSGTMLGRSAEPAANAASSGRS